MHTPGNNHFVSHDGAIIRGGQLTDENIYHENSYSEIPPPPPEAFHIPDLKALQYNKTLPGSDSYNYHKGPSLSAHQSSLSRPQSTRHLAGSQMGIHKGQGKAGVDDLLELEYYSEIRRPLCHCTKQVTTHVLFMALAGLVYLGIGGITGFWIGKSCKCKFNF